MHRLQFFGHCNLLVIVHDLHVEGVAVFPEKTDTVLVINADTVLPVAVSLQRFKVVSRSGRQIRQPLSCIEHSQFAQRHTFDCLESPDPFAVKQSLSLARAVGFDHWVSL